MKGHRMKFIFRVIPVLLALSSFAAGQTPGIHDDLLDHMTGTWILTGTIAGQQTTHDITAAWILGHNYIRIQEISREKDSLGNPAYEASVHVGRDVSGNRYACFWLDNTGAGGLAPQSIAYAPTTGDTIAFLFRGSDGVPFHTTFLYDSRNNTWEWRMDGEDNGVLKPFARVTLTRK
jgi:hypothetical protein